MGHFLQGASIAQRLEFYSIPEPNSGCLLWIGALSNAGYGSLRCVAPGDTERRTHVAHRLSWIVHRGPIPVGLWALHKCDIRCCINEQHLFFGTHADNMADMARKGRHRQGDYRGEKHGLTTLTDDQVRALRIDNRRGQALADAYGISFGTACRIKRRETWAHVT